MKLADWNFRRGDVNVAFAHSTFTVATFAKEFRLAAAVKWYEMRQISQERAAEIAALSRAEFIDALGRFGVSPFQYSADEVIAEAEDV